MSKCMKIAYSTNAYLNNSLLQAIQSIADIGFGAVEILCDHPHWIPGEVTKDQIEQVNHILSETNLSISNLNVNTATSLHIGKDSKNHFEPSLSHQDEQVRKQRLSYTLEALKLADAIKAPCISITSGLSNPNISRKDTLYRFTESLKQICDEAEKLGVKVGIEYEPELWFETATQVAEVIEQVGSANLGVNYDIGHSFLNHEDPRDVVDLVGDRIWNVHIEDISGSAHFHKIPGEGEIPFESYFRELERAHYRGFYTVELYTYADSPDTAGQQSLSYLQKVWNRYQQVKI